MDREREPLAESQLEIAQWPRRTSSDTAVQKCEKELRRSELRNVVVRVTDLGDVAGRVRNHDCLMSDDYNPQVERRDGQDEQDQQDKSAVIPSCTSCSSCQCRS